MPDGAKIRSLLFSGSTWQVFDTDGLSNTLVVRPELAQKWIDACILEDSLLDEFTFGSVKYQRLNSNKRYAMTPVENSESPVNRVDAIAFSLALKESRRLSPDGVFHDAIYVGAILEASSAWTLTPALMMLLSWGTWLMVALLFQQILFVD